MKHTISYRFLNENQLPQIHHTFVRAFSDYHLEMSYLTEKVLGLRGIKNNLRYDCSVGAFNQDEMIGFTLIGIDTHANRRSAFDVATGIVKEYRGAGLAGQMFDFARPKLEAEEVENFLLEVLCPNTRAVKAYQKSGFEITRNFACYDLILNDFKYNGTVPGNIVIRPADKTLVREFEHDREWLPSWENSVNGILRIPDETITFGAFDGPVCVGIIVYYPILKWILNLTVKKEVRRKGIARGLMSALVNALPQDLTKISLNNVEKSDRVFSAFLLSAGFKHLIDQYEMQLTL